MAASDGESVDELVSVGVLSLHNSKEAKAICNAVEGLGHRPDETLTAMHKVASAVTLSNADLPAPDALLALSSDRLNQAREE